MKKFNTKLKYLKIDSNTLAKFIIRSNNGMKHLKNKDFKNNRKPIKNTCCF